MKESVVSGHDEQTKAHKLESVRILPKRFKLRMCLLGGSQNSITERRSRSTGFIKRGLAGS